MHVLIIVSFWAINISLHHANASTNANSCVNVYFNLWCNALHPSRFVTGRSTGDRSVYCSVSSVTTAAVSLAFAPWRHTACACLIIIKSMIHACLFQDAGMFCNVLFLRSIGLISALRMTTPRYHAEEEYRATIYCSCWVPSNLMSHWVY